MENSFEYTDELIAKVLAGEASPEEIARLEAWKTASAENADYFIQSKNLFNAIHSSHAPQPVNVDAAWNKLNQRISAEPAAKVIALKNKHTPLARAAAIFIVVALGFLVKFLITDTAPASPQVILAATETTVEKILPDGSKVFMNKHSELSYSVNKNNVREVRLKGEAFFEVVHNEKQPFVISINDVVIRDIGTAFNVKAIPGSTTIEVLVESGEVQFYTIDNSGLTLVKGEKAVYNISSKQFTKITVDPAENTASYRSKMFQFNGATLNEVLEQINEVYGSNIELADKKMGNCRLSVDFNNENIDLIISIIAETLDLQVERSGDRVILKGAACAE